MAISVATGRDTFFNIQAKSLRESGMAMREIMRLYLSSVMLISSLSPKRGITRNSTRRKTSISEMMLP
jgi:hypothetical protein